MVCTASRESRHYPDLCCPFCSLRFLKQLIDYWDSKPLSKYSFKRAIQKFICIWISQLSSHWNYSPLRHKAVILFIYPPSDWGPYLSGVYTSVILLVNGEMWSCQWLFSYSYKEFGFPFYIILLARFSLFMWL